MIDCQKVVCDHATVQSIVNQLRLPGNLNGDNQTCLNAIHPINYGGAFGFVCVHGICEVTCNNAKLCTGVCDENCLRWGPAEDPLDFTCGSKVMDVVANGRVHRRRKEFICYDHAMLQNAWTDTLCPNDERGQMAAFAKDWTRNGKCESFFWNANKWEGFPEEWWTNMRIDHQIQMDVHGITRYLFGVDCQTAPGKCTLYCQGTAVCTGLCGNMDAVPGVHHEKNCLRYQIFLKL